MTKTNLLESAVQIAILLVLPPLLVGVVQRTKAWFAGRRGAPVTQPYRDLARLLRKGAVYSRTATWVFRAGPIAGLATVLAAGLLVPLSAARAPLGFAGDVIVFASFLGLGRFLTLVAALDTGSAFEGMGASRDAAFSALAEPALAFVLGILCVRAHSVSLVDVLGPLPLGAVSSGLPHPALLLAAVALGGILLAENSRIPVDDPTTHLELTMIHEVMVLDHSGPDLAFILYGQAVKLFLFAGLLVRVLVPMHGGPLGAAILIGGTFIVAVLVGIVESSMARLRLSRVPQFLVGTSALGAIGIAILFFQGMS